MTTRIKLRRDTAANWTSNNPILAAGEPGLETDTGKTKYGDGATAWAGLSYATGGSVVPRQVLGSFNVHGLLPNISDSGQDWWFESVVGDPNGGAYYIGGWFEYDNYTGNGQVVKVDTLGDVVWAKELNWADGYEGTGISGVYNTATDQLVVVANWQKFTNGDEDSDSVAIITMDADTGAMVGDVTIIRDDYTADGSDYGWVEPSDIELTASGDPIVIGQRHGSITSYEVTTQTGSTVDIMFADATGFSAGAYPVRYQDWYITGTNISNRIGIVGVNEYFNVSPTPLASTGTGAVFVISKDGSNGYVVDSITNGGSNYFVGNKIQVLGSALGGDDTTNDAVITVGGVDAGVITSVYSTYGISTAGTDQYTDITGANIVSGANFVIGNGWNMKGSEVYFPDYQSRFGFYQQQNGSGYALGDRFLVNAADYGGTTTGTIIVTNVGGLGDGQIYDFAFTGTFNTSTVKLTTNNSMDFGTPGTWQVQNLDNQAWMWTPDWQVTFGDTDNDAANAMATDSAGNIYVACRTYDRSFDNGTTRGVLVKSDSSGNLLWSKNFDPEGYNDYNDGYTGVAVDSEDNVVICSDSVVTKISSTGTVIWQNYIGFNEPIDTWNSCVDVDSDGNVYYAAEHDSMFSSNDDYLIVKFDTDGVVQWQRTAGSSNDEDTNWSNGYQIISIQGNNFYIAGSSYQGEDDVAFGAAFPTDGTGAGGGSHNRFFYRTVDWTVTTSTVTVQDMDIYWSTATNLTVSTTSSFVATTSTATDYVFAVRTGDTDGRIENLYSIKFEDGTEQTTAYNAGYSIGNDSPKIYNTDDYHLTLSDAGKMTRWVAEYWNNTQHIYVPLNSSEPFEIGTQIHFMKDQGFGAFMFWTQSSDITIIPASPSEYMTGYAFNSGEGWSVRHPDYTHIPCIITLTKVDTDRWLLSCNSNTHIMDWSW